MAGHVDHAPFLAAASGIATLDAGSLVVQDPTNAVSAVTANKIVKRDASADILVNATAASGNYAIGKTEAQALIDAAVIAGSNWKELLLVKEQLLNGASGGILQALLVYIATLPTANDTFILTDGVTTETFTFKAVEGAAFDVEIVAGDAPATLVKLIAAINDDSTLWSAIATTTLDKYFAGTPAAQAVIYRTATSTNNDRAYGTLTAGDGIKVVGFYTATKLNYEIASGTEASLPAVDPAAKRFGIGRLKASLVEETHSIAEDGATYAWDSDGEAWNQKDISKLTSGDGIDATLEVTELT